MSVVLVLLMVVVVSPITFMALMVSVVQHHHGQIDMFWITGEMMDGDGLLTLLQVLLEQDMLT
jgi:hypothetical protein